MFQSIRPIQTQASAIQSARAHREECRRLLAQDSQQMETAAFSVLIPLLPPAYRPLVIALVEENNELLVRVRQRARQNHVLLSRSLEFMQSFLNTLLPRAKPGYATTTETLTRTSLPRSTCMKPSVDPHRL